MTQILTFLILFKKEKIIQQNNCDQNMMNFIEEGWEEENNDEGHDHAHIVNKFVAKQKPLGILASTKHSLEPDMIFGWKPKLPSCPLPLKFANPQTQKLINLLNIDDRFKIAYKGKHFVSSVQVNQQYAYYWKYRTRYSLNLALIEEAAKQQQTQVTPQVTEQQCEYTFDSNFQSGNLDMAVRVKSNQYDCFIRSDSNTRGHCNWYFFSVSNGNRIGQVKINVCNIGKTKNLYNKGMKPYVKQTSEGLNAQANDEWSQQPCYAVQFVQRICRYGSQTKRFELQFRYNFSKPKQEVFFAYGVPYTYSKLQRFIKQISCEENESILTVQKLCQSLGGLNVPLLKITNNAKSESPIDLHKKAVLISARIHPGESHSSYIMEGVIRQILKNQENYKILREMFVFYIIPMINVDGVVIGNYRTSYSGKDLNRQFKDLNNFVFPQITRIHELALQVRQKHFKGIQFYLDFHGHSSKKNLFAYGPDHSPRSIYFFKSRIFPKLIQEIHPIFSYKKSIFKISQGKKKTARAHMLWKIKIPMVYTFQVSNGMYETKNRENVLLNEKILLDAGQSIMKGFFKYVRIEMKIPSKLMNKKVSRQNIKKRVVKSSKALRDSSIAGKRKGSKLGDIGNLQFVSQKLVDNKMRIFSKNQQGLKQHNNGGIQDEQNEMNQQQHQKLDEFMHLIQEIKHTKLEEDIEGGSDSQSQGDDLEKQETDKLFKRIQNKKMLKELKQTKKSKIPRPSKSKPKASIAEDSSNIFNEIKRQFKKYKNSELEEFIKQGNKLNSQISYVTLPANKTQVLQKSSSMADRLSKMGIRISNLGNTRQGCGQKVIKVPITQKNFNLEI